MRFWGKLIDSSSLQPLKVFDDICKTESGISIRFNAEQPKKLPVPIYCNLSGKTIDSIFLQFIKANGCIISVF